MCSPLNDFHCWCLYSRCLHSLSPAQYDQLTSSLEDYAEIAIGFGYTSLFVTALPIAAFFELLANIAGEHGLLSTLSQDTYLLSHHCILPLFRNQDGRLEADPPAQAPFSEGL